MPVDPNTDAAAPWIRPLVLVVAAVVFVIIGATGGIAVGLSGLLSPPATFPPGRVAIGFAQDLLAHDRQAVRIAAAVRDRTADPAIRELAAAIESSTAPEAGRLLGWLESWGAPEQALAGPTRWVPLTGGEHGHGSAVTADDPAPEHGSSLVLPGLITDDELSGLENAAGVDLDVSFLQLMLRHHEEGEAMLDIGSEVAELPAVRDLGVVRLEQEAEEGTTMRRMLADRGEFPLP